MFSRIFLFRFCPGFFLFPSQCGLLRQKSRPILGSLNENALGWNSFVIHSFRDRTELFCVPIVRQHGARQMEGRYAIQSSAVYSHRVLDPYRHLIIHHQYRHRDTHHNISLLTYVAKLSQQRSVLQTSWWSRSCPVGKNDHSSVDFLSSCYGGHVTNLGSDHYIHPQNDHKQTFDLQASPGRQLLLLQSSFPWFGAPFEVEYNPSSSHPSLLSSW